MDNFFQGAPPGLSWLGTARWLIRMDEGTLDDKVIFSYLMSSMFPDITTIQDIKLGGQVSLRNSIFGSNSLQMPNVHPSSGLADLNLFISVGIQNEAKLLNTFTHQSSRMHFKRFHVREPIVCAILQSSYFPCRGIEP